MWVCMWFFFFFKQKTAYEMRISDWSSDVCSSDLSTFHRRHGRDGQKQQFIGSDTAAGAGQVRGAGRGNHYVRRRISQQAHGCARYRRALGAGHCADRCPEPCRRSEEHTYELQSLMRISYAVFRWEQTLNQQTVITAPT